MELNRETITELERNSILRFIEDNAHYFRGNVIDIGSGKEPYRDIIEHEGAIYFPSDDPSYPGYVGEDKHIKNWRENFELAKHIIERDKFDVALCTQVIQYAPNPQDFLKEIRYSLKYDGILLITYPTSWHVIEEDDLWRFTPNGVTLLLNNANFEIVDSIWRANIEYNDFVFPLGGGIVAEAK